MTWVQYTIDPKNMVLTIMNRAGDGGPSVHLTDMKGLIGKTTWRVRPSHSAKGDVYDTTVRNCDESVEQFDDARQDFANVQKLHTLVPEYCSPRRCRVYPMRLLRYEEGGHFVAHKDSQLADTHVGTLLVYPPAYAKRPFEGGDLVIYDSTGTTIQHTLCPSKFKQWTVVAMTFEVMHACTPVTSGTRYVFKGPLFVEPWQILDPRADAVLATPDTDTWRNAMYHELRAIVTTINPGDHENEEPNYQRLRTYSSHGVTNLVPTYAHRNALKGPDPCTCPEHWPHTDRKADMLLQEFAEDDIVCKRAKIHESIVQEFWDRRKIIDVKYVARCAKAQLSQTLTEKVWKSITNDYKDEIHKLQTGPYVRNLNDQYMNDDESYFPEEREVHLNLHSYSLDMREIKIRKSLSDMILALRAGRLPGVEKTMDMVRSTLAMPTDYVGSADIVNGEYVDCTWDPTYVTPVQLVSWDLYQKSLSPLPITHATCNACDSVVFAGNPCPTDAWVVLPRWYGVRPSADDLGGDDQMLYHALKTDYPRTRLESVTMSGTMSSNLYEFGSDMSEDHRIMDVSGTLKSCGITIATNPILHMQDHTYLYGIMKGRGSTYDDQDTTYYTDGHVTVIHVIRTLHEVPFVIPVDVKYELAAVCP